MSKKPPIIDFDNNWKEVIEKHVREAVQFFLPVLDPEVDWTRTPVFLEQELRNIRRKTLKGRKKIVDKLIKVWLKNGEERWILIHIEIESSDDEGFNKRMFNYFSRAFDKYDVAIVALALLVGEKPPPSFNKYEIRNWGTYLTYGYDAYVVAHQNEDELLASPNIFALFILANLYTIKTKDDMQRRLELKKKMYELAVERNIPLQTMDNLITFVFQIMTLPLQEHSDFKKYFDEKEKKRDMTEVAYQKRRLKTQKEIANLHTKAVYGFYVDDIVKEMNAAENVVKEQRNALKEKDIVLKEKDIVLKEKDNALIEKDNVLKEKENKLHRTIIYLYTKDEKSKEDIAVIMQIPLEEIEAVIADHEKKDKLE
jgi:hypothetical protein